MVPAMTLDVPKMQKAKTEAPSFMRIRQTDQQISDLLVLGLQFGTVTIAGFADPEGPARQRNADTLPPDYSLGHLTALRWPYYFFPRASFRSSFCMLS